jgi:hypothetical protein
VLGRGCITSGIRILLIFVITVIEDATVLSHPIFFDLRKCAHFDANDDERSQHNPIDVNCNIPTIKIARIPHTPNPVIRQSVQSFLEKTNHQRKQARLSQSTKEVVAVTPTSSIDAVGQEQKGEEDEGHRNDKVPDPVRVAKAHGEE